MLANIHLLRFNNYIANNGFTNVSNLNVSKTEMDKLYSKIVKDGGIDVSNLQNVSLNYGEYEFNTTITFTTSSSYPPQHY